MPDTNELTILLTPLQFVEVGNEDSLNGGAPTYAAYRLNILYNAISQTYPDITIISSYYDVDGATPPFNASGGKTTCFDR